MVTAKKINTILSALLLLILTLTALYRPMPVHAETITCADNSVHDVAESDSSNPGALCAANGGIKSGATVQPSATPPAPQEQVKYVKNDCNPPAGEALGQNNCGIIKYVVLFIKALSALVGVAVVASVIIGGIQYSASGGDPSGVAAAKKRIVNAILALAVYIFMFALLQYLIPGGVLQ